MYLNYLLFRITYNQMILKYIFSSNFKVIILYIKKLVANVAATD